MNNTRQLSSQEQDNTNPDQHMKKEKVCVKTVFFLLKNLPGLSPIKKKSEF
jgi:hypothetical protein